MDFNNDIEEGYYLHSKKLGEGGFGIVKLGTHLLTRQQVAIKIINKEKIIKDLYRIKTEIQALKLLSHKNIAKLLQVIETPKYIYLVLEYCAGGELFDHLIAHKVLPSNEVKRIIFSLVNVLKYIHGKGIAHRDIKPENILLDADHNIKLIDFGLSACAVHTANGTLDGLKTACGSPAYVAPELLEGIEYSGPAADVWSTGVLMFTLLTGVLPFADKNTAILYKKIRRGEIDLTGVVDKDARDLLKQMICVNQTKRITVQNILSHPWFKSTCIKYIQRTQVSNLEEEVGEINEDILKKCASLFRSYDDDSLHLLRQKIMLGYGYEKATYLLLKDNPSQFKIPEILPGKEIVNRRRSRSFSEYKSPNNRIMVPKRREHFEESTRPKMANTDVKTKPISTRGTTTENKKTARKLFATDENVFKLPNCTNVPKQVANKLPTPNCRRNQVLNMVNNLENKTAEVEYVNSPIKGKSMGCTHETPTKKTFFKRLLESATPHKTLTPRRFALNDTSSNVRKDITVTNFKDIEECKERIIAVMSAKNVNCTLMKNFTIRCVVSSMNQIILAFELEMLICRNSGCIGIHRKRISGNSWDYVRICEELRKVTKSTKPNLC